jgi:hypothetical protein
MHRKCETAHKTSPKRRNWHTEIKMGESMENMEK